MILLVAVFMLFVVGAMAALAIDVVTLYGARSEAQLAADSAALAGARVLANSGMTSDTTGGLAPAAEALATTVAKQVATSNDVGGRNLKPTEVNVSFNDTAPSFATNPHVTVQVQRTDVPTFFARIWGSTQVTVGASATAEAYNPSPPPAFATPGGGGPPVAPICVKPWLLPNIDPTQTNPSNPIFNPSGAISNPGLVGQSWPNATNLKGLYAGCGDCSFSGGGITAPAPGAYYPGDPTYFPAPTQALPACSAGFIKPYQLAVAGCVQQPISCGSTALVNIDVGAYGPTRDLDTVDAVKCLIHYNAPGDSDSIDLTATPVPPFEFLGGNLNPVAGAVGTDVLVSDSLVTIPVINYPPGTPFNPVQVIGFLQVFLNPQTGGALPPPLPGPPQIPATIINMAGCGYSVTTAQPILGNGSSPVPVRLISPP